jgi:hypothetical protein
MHKKNNKHPILIISLSVLSLILICGLIYTYKFCITNAKKNEIHNSINETLGGIRINRFVRQKSVKDTFTYSLPSGWMEEINSSTDTVVDLKSEDYNRELMQGAQVSLNVTPKDLFMTLEEIKRGITKAGNSNFTDIQIDKVSGIKVVTIENRYEGYIFIKGKYLIQIDILVLPQNISKDINDKYWNDINSIINSIQFK